MSGSQGTTLTAGRPLLHEDATQSTVSLLARKSAKLRQQTLFSYTVPKEGPRHERGLSKKEEDFALSARQSLPWGDPYLVGDGVNIADLFRLVSHNVNGLSASDDHADVAHMATSMALKSVAIFGLQETNRNFERRSMLESFHRVVRSTCTHHVGAVSSAKLQWPQDYQPGGTAVSVRNKWATRFLARGSDSLGRWSWITLAGRGTTQVTFLSGYRVCDGAREASITSRTVRAQQEWMYADRGHVTINLREQFVTDLTAIVNDFQMKGHSVVVMMDANEGNGAGSAADRLCFDCNMADAHSLNGRTDLPPPTYQRGTKKIDFVLVSANIAHTVRSSSILALHDGYLSDHRALLVDFDATALFQSATSEVTTATERRLTSTSPQAVHSYIAAMKLQVEKHNLEAKVLQLQQQSEEGNWTDLLVEEWEQIDGILAESRLAAERKCKAKRTGLLPWSPDLQTSGRTVLYWRMRMRAFTGRYVNVAELHKLETMIPIAAPDMEHLPALAVRGKIRQSLRNHKSVKADAQRLREEHLIERATFLSATHGMAKHAACAAIEAREKTSRQFRLLRSIFNPGASYGLDRIDVPNSSAVLRREEEIPRIPLVVKEQIEEVLVPHTEQRFRQHRETPFGSGIRQQELGMDCTSDDAHALMEGSYDRELEALSDEARVWLLELKRKDFVNAGSVISTNISTGDWISG